ncbi:hypothetical protein PN498_11440 [Oscillatoria sp. CS-180]|uniref:DUF6737 family protein n=1 Tax=Oscillatoria sp. CS-180 TaxID=3021720 RepID=UPI00232D4C4B|nr:DUF6737 family protein [Oscillatoria sp. CS-180]MDB9526606.1 hypothetical protein [Oscillatoria sp. CS-180]
MDSSKSASVWDYKPWWCQPWSILLTGISAIAGSWLLFHRYWLTGLVALPITTWMVFFVVIWPRLIINANLIESESNLESTQL